MKMTSTLKPTNLKFAVIAAAVAITSIAVIGVAHAQKGDRMQRAAHMFERMDADKDGSITRDDVKAFAATQFAKMDANSDGTVTSPERRAFRQALRAERRANRFSRCLLYTSDAADE